MEFCDATLKAENVTFSAHRVVLAGNSPYLKNIFLSQNAEALSLEVILPNDVRSKTVRLMLDYFYMVIFLAKFSILYLIIHGTTVET